MNALVHSCPLCGGPLADDRRVLVDFDGGLVVGNGHVAALTKAEFQLFAALWRARPRTMIKEQLLAATPGGLGVDDREIKLVDVFVHKARKKLEPLGITIETVWGRGYRIAKGQGPDA